MLLMEEGIEEMLTQFGGNTKLGEVSNTWKERFSKKNKKRLENWVGTNRMKFKEKRKVMHLGIKKERNTIQYDENLTQEQHMWEGLQVEHVPTM